jgi:hypothetical protein
MIIERQTRVAITVQENEMPAPLDDRLESLLWVGRAVLGEPALAHPAEHCGIPACTHSGEDY